jgi:hypothetical protein
MSVEQDNQWPTERYMMHWQPRELPASEPEGSIVLAGPALKSEHMEALRILDQLALAYTSQTLRSVNVPCHSNQSFVKRIVQQAPG